MKVIIIAILVGNLLFCFSENIYTKDNSMKTYAIDHSENLLSPLEEKAFAFLNKNRSKWTDWNVPYEDGQELYNLIVANDYKSALEIGTSTGHSTIWLALAMAKTGGKVITLEIDESRHKQALRNFAEAGVSHLIDARLGDAFKIIPTLKSNFDFVFSDATSARSANEGYTDFLKSVESKLIVGASYTMHNVTDGYGDDGRFFRYLEKLGNYKTHIIKSSSAGISVSKKIK